MTHDASERLAAAAEEFNRHEGREDGARVCGSLADGLTLLCESVFRRIHQDVEKAVGVDSMLMPVSEAKAQQRTVEEIELFQAAESAAAVGEFGYLSSEDPWYLRWLARLTLGDRAAEPDADERLLRYRSQTSEERRLAFTDALSHTLAESRQAPLVLFRLHPLAVQIATALAFDDHPRATDLRREQLAVHPAIADCGRCRARLLDNGEQCPACGNPLWKYQWLAVAD